MELSILLVILTSLLTAGAQLLIKGVAPELNLRSLFAPPLILGVLIALGAPLLYYRALEGIPLSLAFSLSALSYVWVPLGAVLFLKERVCRRQRAGIVLVIAGVLLWGIL